MKAQGRLLRGRPAKMVIKTFQIKKTTLDRIMAQRRRLGLVWWFIFDEFASYLEAYEIDDAPRHIGFRRKI